MPGEVLQYAGAGRHRARAGAGRHCRQAGGRRGLGLSTRHSVVKKPALPLNFRLLPFTVHPKQFEGFIPSSADGIATFLFEVENSWWHFCS